MKKILSLVIVFAFLPILVSCGMNDSGIIKWTYKDELLNWKDVRNAAYYELEIFETDSTTNEPRLPLTPILTEGYRFYAYGSQYSFYGLPIDTTFNFRIKVYYEDGTSSESEIIRIRHEMEFPYPTRVGIGNYVGDILSWTDLSSSEWNLINYTLKINDDEYEVDSNIYDMSDYDHGVYNIQVKANYEEGSSIWTRPYYAYIDSQSLQLQDTYDLDSGQDYHYNLTNGKEILAVLGLYGIFGSYTLLPNDIVTIDGSGFTLNHYYIETEGKTPNEVVSIIMSVYIVTEEDIYNLYIMHDPI